MLGNKAFVAEEQDACMHYQSRPQTPAVQPKQILTDRGHSYCVSFYVVLMHRGSWQKLIFTCDLILMHGKNGIFSISW